ncbi:MAG: hypothetical protein P8J14_11140 [Emcibacteraceae bacterium]|nr:hypothetical protein [Emcibacteraceae bacterium]
MAAKRFTDQVGIQQQNLSTGFTQGASGLLNRLNQFKKSTDRLITTTETKKGQEEAQQVNLEKETVEGSLGREHQVTSKPKKKESGFFEDVFSGGAGTAQYNKVLETAYLASLGNDTKEAINKIEAENPDNILGFNEKAEGYAAGVMATVDPAARQQVKQFIDGQVSNSRSRVHRATIKKNKANAIAESNEAITSFGNEAASLAREGNSEGAAEAALQSFAVIDGLVESGDLMADKAANVKREINREMTEQVSRKKFDDLLSTKGVDEAQAELDKIRGKNPKGWTPDEWQTYTNSQQTDINRQKAKIGARSQAVSKEAAKALKQYETAVSLGFEVDPQEQIRVKELVAGTDNQEVFDRINKTAAFSVLSSSERTEQLNDLETGQLDDVADFTAALKANNEINVAASKDGYSLGVKQGLIEDITFNPSDPLTLALKADQAETLSTHYGVQVSPLSDGEANSLSANIDLMTVAEKVQLAGTLNEAPAVWNQISPKNQQAFSMAGATGDNVLMTTVFQGQELIKNKLVSAPKAADYLSISDDFLSDVYGIQDKSAIIEAAKAHYAATAGNVDVFDADAFEDSLSAVTGGIGEVNGSKVELPRGVDEDSFEDFINEFSGAQVAGLGGVIGFDDNQAANAIQNGKIKSIGANKYIVMTNGSQALFKNDGEPLIIEFTSEAVAQQEAKKFIKSKTIESGISKLRSF